LRCIKYIRYTNYTYYILTKIYIIRLIVKDFEQGKLINCYYIYILSVFNIFNNKNVNKSIIFYDSQFYTNDTSIKSFLKFLNILKNTNDFKHTFQL